MARFLGDLERRLDELADSILEERAPEGRSRSFTIHDPKRRTIVAACFSDRVLHHAILNRAEARFERGLVESSFACRPGKGVHRAVLRVQRHLRAWPWFVQVDVDGYFPSIDHGILLRLLAARFKGPGFLALLARILATGAGPVPGRGLPIGSLVSQHCANLYLDGADRFLLAHRAVRGHVRYMDDIVWWCASRTEAVESLEDLRAWLLRERHLRLKDGARVARSAEGLAYCGFRVRRGVLLASSRRLSRYRAGIARLGEALAAGRATGLEVQRASDGLLATLAGTQTAGFRRRLELPWNLRDEPGSAPRYPGAKDAGPENVASASCAAAPGSTTPGGCAPPTATRTSGATATTTSASASP